MSDEIIKVLDVLAAKFGLAFDWTSSNVFPYLEQLCGKYINYEIATSVVWIVFGIICLFFGNVFFKKIKIYYEKSDNLNADNGYAWLCVGSVIGFVISVIVGFIVIGHQIFDIITCYTFPEKIIIDELKSIYENMR